MADPQFPTRDIRDVGLQAGSPAAFASLGTQTARGVAGESSDQSRLFGLALMDLLKSFQGIERKPFAAQELAAQEAQARRLAATSPELIGAAPGVQARARGAAVEALEPTIAGARRAGQTFTGQLESFESILTQARGLAQQQQQEEARRRDDARALFSSALSVGSEALQGLLDQQPDLLKAAGLNPETAKFFIQAKKSEEQRKVTGTGAGIRDDERALQQIYLNQPIVKNYNEQLNKKLSVDSIVNAGVGGPGDLALVYEFMKALDPTSVVRETEYATAAKSGNIFAGVFARFNGYLREEGGFLPERVKKSFQELVNRKFKVQEQLYNNLRTQFRSQAQRQGLDPDNITLDFGAAISPQTPKTVKKGGRTFRVIE